MVVIERRDRAEARGAEVLGTLLGWGMSSDGTGQMVAPDPAGAQAAMEGAMRHAGLAPEQVDYVNTHATSTPVGDLSEVRAMRAVFGAHRPAYSSTKGYTGHTVSGAGALEAVLTWAMLREGWLAGCVNADPIDPELEDWPPLLSPSDAPSDATGGPYRVALSDSFGFGGTNACLALGR